MSFIKGSRKYTIAVISPAALKTVRYKTTRFRQEKKKKKKTKGTGLISGLRIMQAFSNTYVCPYFPCTSPYCIALRSTALAPPSIQSLNRPPTSPPSQPGISSFTISSILSRSEEPSAKTNREAETNSSKASSTEASQSVLKMTPYASHISIERLPPYHRSLTSGVGFTRATCNALHKGNSRDELDIEIVSQLMSYFYRIGTFIFTFQKHFVKCSLSTREL